MSIKNVYLSIVFLFYSILMIGQDLNQINTRYFPLYLNPALTGNFYGNFRIGGTYRDQGVDFMSKYKTINLYIDAPISISLRGNDWVGIGIQVYNDKAGSVQMITQGVILNGSYHLVFDKKYKNVISFGVQYGLLQRKIDGDKLNLASDYIDPGVPLTDRARLIAYDAKIKDINIGIVYKMKLDKISNFTIGLSVYHLTKPTYEGIVYSNYYNRRITFHSNLFYGISKRFMVKPQIIASFSKNAYNIMPQFKAFFKFSKEKRKTDLAYFGLGYRLKDALQVLLGMRFKNYDFGIAYDITISSAAKYNNSRGGIEFGIFKILQKPKKRKVTPVLICPNL